MMTKDIFLTWAAESELNSLMNGQIAGDLVPWPSMARMDSSNDRVGVLLMVPDGDAERLQPLALVVPENQRRRLFTRFATLRDDVSPISAWSHVMNPALFDLVDDLDRTPSLDGLESCWAGLIVAEALILSRRPVQSLRAPACFATMSFSIGRAQALWPRVKRDEVIDRFEVANSLVRSSPPQHSLIKEFQPIWSILADAPLSYGSSRNPIGTALLGLREARWNDELNPYLLVSQALSAWPESSLIAEFGQLHPEARVQAFDHIMEEIRRGPKTGERRDMLSFIAGFVASVAAGGAPSLGLAEAVANEFPAVLAWAYVLIGARQKIAWSSTFSGLGRLVTRELARPFHFSEPPQCDFALDEAMSVIDRQLSDPFVHLRLKQRGISVALLPGVNLTLPMQETPVTAVATARQSNRHGSLTENRSDLSRLADDLWPHLVERIKQEIGKHSKTSSTRKKSTAQGKFSLE
ncbi:hypothetical protein ACSV5N_16870 [Agrobacterium salinitolerans]|uniref:hypothetical protein n=1 Tax=Agrobacterium salinitolerans TaxID=1183413 RepID=UPI003FD45436